MHDTLFAKPYSASARWALIASGLVIAIAIASAQTVPSPTRDTTEPAVLELTPFTVDTTRDQGFVAASSLAGGRLAGDLADTPVAYSVITREFIDALNLTSLTEAVEWTVNATNNTDNGANDTFGTVSTYNIRGVRSNGQQRNFFPFNVNYDSYNLERFDFARGANSILFGNGSIGGTANTVTKQALARTSFEQVQATLGSWNNYRLTVDINRPVTERLAVRANVVWQDSKSWRDRDFSDKSGVFLTGTYRLSQATTIRLEGEYGEMQRLNSFTSISDNLSGWDGVTTFSSLLNTVPAGLNNRGVARNGTGYYVYAPASGVKDIVSYTNTATTLGGGANNQIPIGGQFPVGPTVAASGQPMLYALNLPANRFDNAISGSSFHIPDRKFTVSPDVPFLTQRFKDIALYLNHRFGDSLFVELAADFNNEYRTAELTGNRGITSTYIDINQNLPTGASNPNFLVPYNESARYWQTRESTSSNVRGAVGYARDTRFGKFKFNLIAGLNEQESTAEGWIYGLRINPDSRLWWQTDLPRFRYYWGQADRSLNELGTINLIDPIAGTTRAVTPGWVLDISRPELDAITRSDYVYAQAAVSAKFFRDRLHVLGAVRRDDYSTNVRYTIPAMDYPVGWQGRDTIFKPPAPDDYYDLMYTPKNANGVAIGEPRLADIRPRTAAAAGVPLPQYAGDRFRDDFSPPDIASALTTMSTGAVLHLSHWASVYANYAETYNAPSSVPRLDGSLLPATIAEGIDFGLRFSLLQRKLNISIGRFLGAEDNQPVSPGIGAGIWNGIIRANAIGDLSEDGRNIRGVPDVPSVVTDIRQRRNEGYEFEAVANLSSSWRLLFNAASTRAYQENAFPDTLAFIERNEPIFRLIMADAGIKIDDNNVASLDTSVPAALRPPDSNSALAQWNAFQAAKRGLVTGRQKVTGVVEFTANMFTDYTFKRGFLKGLKVGAGVNYRGRQVIGNRGADTIRNPSNPAAAIDDPAVDAYTPVYRDPYSLVTATFAYSFKLPKSKRLNLNLKIDNVLNEDDPVYVSTVMRPPNGDVTNPARVTTPGFYSYIMPVNYTLSATVRF